MDQQAAKVTEPCYVEQRLKVALPEALWDALVYSKREVVAAGHPYLGTAIDVKYPSGNNAGVLVYYPGISVESLGKLTRA